MLGKRADKALIVDEKCKASLNDSFVRRNRIENDNIVFNSKPNIVFSKRF